MAKFLLVKREGGTFHVTVHDEFSDALTALESAIGKKADFRPNREAFSKKLLVSGQPSVVLEAHERGFFRAKDYFIIRNPESRSWCFMFNLKPDGMDLVRIGKAVKTAENAPRVSWKRDRKKKTLKVYAA